MIFWLGRVRKILKTNDFDKILDFILKITFESELPIVEGIKAAWNLNRNVYWYEKWDTRVWRSDFNDKNLNKGNPNAINFGRNVLEEHKKDFEKEVYDLNPDKEDYEIKLDWDSLQKNIHINDELKIIHMF